MRVTRRMSGSGSSRVSRSDRQSEGALNKQQHEYPYSQVA